MGNSQSIRKINFEDLQIAIKNNEKYIIINTLNDDEQNCLIKNTIHKEQEENVINQALKYNKNVKIIIYGKNSSDEKIYKKYNQLISLQFYETYIFVGGLFLWLLLQDIYGDENFPTTNKCLDILKFKEQPILNIKYITYN